MRRTSFALSLSIFLLLSCVFISCSCSIAHSDVNEQIVIMNYNVELLFDDNDNGDEYSPYTLEEGWSTSLYHERLNTLSNIIIQNNPQEVDILVLQEVEHEGVVRDLIDRHLGKRGFHHYVVSDNPSSPIEVGVVSRYPIINAYIHTVAQYRPILEVILDIKGERVSLFVLHLPSNRIGKQESETQRIENVRALQYIMSSYEGTYWDIPCIIAGDFNESSDAYDRNMEGFQTALIESKHNRASEFKELGSLLVTGEVPNDHSWYSFYLDQEEMIDESVGGSYYYSGLWEGFDHILLSHDFFDNQGLEFVTSGIISHTFMLNKSGTPYRYGQSNNKGVSDHLPVFVVLELKN